jgi:hypothetical protein
MSAPTGDNAIYVPQPYLTGIYVPRRSGPNVNIVISMSDLNRVRRRIDFEDTVDVAPKRQKVGQDGY